MATSIEEIARAGGVSLAYLQRKVSEAHVLQFSRFCTPWELMGSYFGLTSADISAIDRDEHNTELKRRAVIQRWKEANAFKATYHNFIKVLLDHEKAQSAYEVCCILGKEETVEKKKGSGTGVSTVSAVEETRSSSAGAKSSPYQRFKDLPEIRLGIEDFADVLREVLDIIEQWEDLGMALRLHPNDLDAIKQEKTPKDAMKAVLKRWLRQSAPSWQMLSQALRDRLVGRNDIAERMEQIVLEKYKAK